MSGVFPSRFTDEDLIRKIDTALNDIIDLVKFHYKPKKAISTPFSSFLIQTQDNFFTGFDTIVKFYPFEPEFSLRELETAIGAVVNSGIVGVALIATILGETGLEQQVSGDMSSPDAMYR